MEKTCYNCGSPISKETCEDFPEVCEYWSPKKPVTKADHIRAMADEELADWGYSLPACPPDSDLRELCHSENKYFRTSCRECWLDWLKQEVDE